MLPLAELSQLQTEAARALPDTCVIVTPVWLDDGAGGQYEGTPSRSDATSCRISPSGLAPSERLIAERISPDQVLIATFPAGTAIASTSRVEWRGRTFEVVAFSDRSWEITRRVVLKVGLP